MTNLSNTTTDSLFAQNTTEFWVFYTLYMIIGLTTVVGNGLVSEPVTTFSEYLNSYFSGGRDFVRDEVSF